MTNLGIYFGANNPTDNFNVPFYIEIVQNDMVVMSAFSTEGNTANSYLIKQKSDFDEALPVTFRYYNLGNKTNNIQIILKNVISGNAVFNQSGCADGRKGEYTYLLNAGVTAWRLDVICNQTSTTASGVTYSLSNSEIVSAKAGNSTFVSSATPNVALNPNYIASSALTAPTISNSTRLTNETLTFGGMQAGDILKLYIIELIGSPNEPTGLVSSWTIGSTGAYSPYIGSYGGLTMKGKYTRGGVDSPFSGTVAITQYVSNQTLPALTLTPVNANQTGYVTGSQVDITGFSLGGAMDINLPNGSEAVVGVDYNFADIQGGYRLTFLRADTFSIKQVLTGYNDSAAGVIVVAPNPTVNQTFVLTMQNMCTVDIANIQVGTADVAANVTNWTDGLQITIPVTNSIVPNFFARDKTNTTNVSDAKAYVAI